MRFAVNLPCFGPFGEPRALIDLARMAEDHGWDGFFLWDHIGGTRDWAVPFVDPWVMLGAIAARTSMIKLATIVTPLPRRRPWKVAREAVTLDHLSGGRCVLGVGIGGEWGREYSAYGESTDARRHGEQLDEALEVITRLWSGEPTSFVGRHYTLDDALHLPSPLQQPRIPIWVAAVWPHKKPFRRAAQWDGVCPLSVTEQPPTLDEFRDLIAYTRAQRTTDAPFDVTGFGHIDFTDHARDRDTLAPFAAAGVTWWQLGWNFGEPPEPIIAAIRRGPPTM